MYKEEDVINQSKMIIKLNQHPSGGYVACPLFSHYGYSWLRDGSFIAYAMDTAGEPESAGQFYEWVDRVLQTKKDQVQELLRKQREGIWIERSEFLNTRYHLDGRDDHSDWGNFQLDGYGAWLWGLCEHIRRTGNDALLRIYRESIELTVEYLQAFWLFPNYDCWEEFSDYVHPSTLACIYGGLHALGELENRPELLAKAEEIRSFLLEHSVLEQRFVKSVQYQDGKWQPVQPGVDASLLWLALPFGVVEPSDPLMLATVEAIEKELKHEGIQRYAADTYYGGGEWLLLTAWYGWLKAELGDREEANRCLNWIISKADALGRLPEQVPDALRSVSAYDDWVNRLGRPPLPLLWSHAMLLVLSNKLG
ncbi:glycoside hydrolase family 15 protein [Paenibacillus eucommiae]|uniref:GH15 family glucan-1,4-alpha-glucosidase n=1 Tax=Paenibacillus eucommiae TaxID=1355755 RepID=A0ABS4IZ04_9BACL|nr:glycoside hydrolase family 15 protein [Paenibacillus eucommiae]MBP1992832.1 GH15 family glucan-1,4-alpha-glucosidase [Paenibacillus eucommiae]